MKKFLILSFLAFMMIPTSNIISQDVIKTWNLDKKKENTIENVIGNAVITKHNVIYKGETKPVYITKKGKYFIVILSKKGNYYKKYLKEEDAE